MVSLSPGKLFPLGKEKKMTGGPAPLFGIAADAGRFLFTLEGRDGRIRIEGHSGNK